MALIIFIKHELEAKKTLTVLQKVFCDGIRTVLDDVVALC